MASWGLVKVLANRISNVEMQLGPDHVVLSSWSFGQIIAVALLVSPLFSIFRTFFEGQQSEVVMLTRRPDQGLAYGYAPAIGLSSHVLAVVAEPASESRALLGIEARNHPEDSTPSSEPRLATRIASDVTAQGTLPPVLRTNMRAKHAIVRSLVLDESSLKRPWISVCVALACVFWIGVACFASAMTNHNITTGAARLWASGSPLVSMLQFWLTGFGVLWIILFCYPTSIALCVALAIHLEVHFGQRRTPRAVPSWTFAVLTISYVNAQGLAFTSWLLPFVGLPLFTFGPSIGSLAWTILRNLVLVVYFYAAYTLVCFGLLVRQAIATRTNEPATQPDDELGNTTTLGQSRVSLEDGSQN